VPLELPFMSSAAETAGAVNDSLTAVGLVEV